MCTRLSCCVIEDLGRFLGAVRQEAPHAALQALHVHLLGRLGVINLDDVDLEERERDGQNVDLSPGDSSREHSILSVNTFSRPDRKSDSD